MLDTLAAGWREWNGRLLERLDLLEGRQFFCDQVSLSLAFAASPVPFAELPLAMNFPLHIRVEEAPALAEPCEPVIVHYHDRVDPLGYLSPAPNAAAQARIDRFNARVLQARRERFDNRLFWNFRYSHSPELGSGVGSRGEVAAYKREMLQRLVAQCRPESVLDVGCGDQHVSQALPDRGYLGVDISSVVIGKNRQQFPRRGFSCGDLLDPSFTPPGADLVVCLDVLIHLDRLESYRAFVRRLLGLTRRVGIVSGFEAPPQHAHDMTFYHERLSDTLRLAGARRLEMIGEYRQLAVWKYTV
jgi:SAM-dependent methyltransferase